MARTLSVSCDTIPTLDEKQLERLAVGNLFGEQDPDVTAYLRGEGIELYCAALQRVTMSIGDQLAAYARGDFEREDGPKWAAGSRRLKERIDRTLPELHALRAVYRQRANGGLQTAYRHLVAAVTLHRASSAPGMPADERRKADHALWAAVDRITADTPAA